MKSLSLPLPEISTPRNDFFSSITKFKKKKNVKEVPYSDLVIKLMNSKDSYVSLRLLNFVSLLTRGTFRQEPTRRIRLSFVKCAYSDFRVIFFISLEV